MTVSSRWGIIGGGFGLYGYLPALAAIGGHEIYVLSRHREYLEGRRDIQQYASEIQWCDSSVDLLSSVDSLVVAVPPLQQEEIIANLCGRRSFDCLIIEKPVAHSPSAADAVIAAATSVATTVRVGFLCRHLSWAGSVLAHCADNTTEKVGIAWKFLAHHVRKDRDIWKAWHAAGGGPLRFYGIHLIALAAEANYTAVARSELTYDERGRATRWEADFRNGKGGVMEVSVDCTCSDQIFRITADGNQVIQLPEPFAECVQTGVDSRVDLIKHLLATLSGDNRCYYELYSSVNELWEKCEQVTQRVC